MVRRHMYFRCGHLILLATLCSSSFADAQHDCSAVSADFSIQRVSASAGLFSNLINRRGSLRFESRRMLREAEVLISQSPDQPPPEICPEGCQATAGPKILFTSIPEHFIPGDVQEECHERLKETEEAPIVFEAKVFPDLDEFDDWFLSFSQGRNDEGDELYTQCSGICSPRYFIELRKTEEGYEVVTKVICGLARDKSENTYELKVGYRWSCVAGARSQ